MSNPTAIPARPVSLFTIVFLAVVFAAFFFVARHFYHPTVTAPQNAAAENLTKELEWRATAKSRRDTLSELRAQQQKQETTYGWADEKAGVVRLPIDRAMQLTVEKYATKK